MNPNRVNLIADLSMDLASLTSETTVGAEFQLAQSKLHMTVDSKALIKSSLEVKLFLFHPYDFANVRVPLDKNPSSLAIAIISRNVAHERPLQIWIWPDCQQLDFPNTS